jgi:hypothetical protein
MKANDHLIKSSRGLVPTARNTAKALNTPICAKFPEAASFDMKAWDLFLTVGFVWAALSALETANVPKTEIEEIRGIVGESLARIFPKGLQALDHCTLFMNQTMGSNAQLQVNDALGYWIVWNLLGRNDFTDDESNFVRVLGDIAMKEFATFWP